MSSKKSLYIGTAASAFEREPLIHSYGFKGGQITRLWQIVSQLQDGSGNNTIGLGVQSPLWSDAKVTGQWGESGSNALMYALTNRALQMVSDQTFDSPIQLVDDILDEVHQYGIKITNSPNLRKTFALNSLVSIDHAAWLLYAEQNQMGTFDEFVPDSYKQGLSHENSKVASIPSISYSTSDSEIRQLANEGYFFIKIKIGSPGTQPIMLEKDMERIKNVHQILSSFHAPSSPNGKILYYLDANGRYESKEDFKRFLDYCAKLGAFEQIAIVEEPFGESLQIDVSDIPVRIAADESAHTDQDALKRMEMGYSAMALKPVAKTLSMTIKIAQLAHSKGVPCLCADLTVNPIMVDWNKCVAARLSPLPGLDVGLLETNGYQNYLNWQTMVSYHPKGNAAWNQSVNGIFHTNRSFYRESAGIFLPADHYSNLLTD